MIQQAIHILKNGGLVALPTETVYGLAADATHLSALKKIFAAKGRPIDHPLIVHIGDISYLSEWAIDISSAAMQLAHAFWPGPLTLILKKASHVLPIITGGQETIGIRIPNHPLALELLKAFGGGLAAPSANRFGRISPTTALAVREELGDAVDLILDGGQCAVGVESTIVDMTGAHPVVLRPGMISEAQIASVLDDPVRARSEKSPRVSGSHASHYAPRTPTFLMTGVELMYYFSQHSSHEKIIVLAREYVAAGIDQVTMPHDPISYAYDLYHTLRSIDKKGYDRILIEQVPETGEWEAIRDRLRRAAV
jgi:L-threonylcarbamoyladenylate synthase